MEWISAKDRLPGVSGEYIVEKDGFVFSAEFVAGSGANYWSGKFENKLVRVTHWMPLPEPPKAGD